MECSARAKLCVPVSYCWSRQRRHLHQPISRSLCPGTSSARLTYVVTEVCSYRVLLRQLELSATTTGRLSPEELSQLSERILALVADGSQPSALASQISAFAKILGCLDAIRRGESSASKLLGTMGKSALDSLKSTVDAHPSQGITPNKPAVIAAAKTRSSAPACPTTQVRKALSPKQPSHCTGNSQLTPPRRIAASPPDKATRTPSHAVYSLDEPQKSLAILSTLVSDVPWSPANVSRRHLC